ncbi:hypothetical protein [Novipirellula rosea]|uniref:Type I restriction endonuclease subunit M n=1 Tax=Novipirellula rosea TaxID=1031540 RepID=A0ABP8M797_9BACT
MSKRLFELGQVVATPGALELLERHSMTPMQFLQRHVTGDFGDLCAEDKEANDEGIWNRERILSSYKISEMEKLWVITEADRSSTCCLLPEEY